LSFLLSHWQSWETFFPGVPLSGGCRRGLRLHPLCLCRPRGAGCALQQTLCLTRSGNTSRDAVFSCYHGRVGVPYPVCGTRNCFFVRYAPDRANPTLYEDSKTAAGKVDRISLIFVTNRTVESVGAIRNLKSLNRRRQPFQCYVMMCSKQLK